MLHKFEIGGSFENMWGSVFSSSPALLQKWEQTFYYFEEASASASPL